MSRLEAPFPWFGGKRRVADIVWQALGDVHVYVEPFFGSGAVLLGRPANHTGTIETVNDLDGFVANFWRATQAAPEEVARHADQPVFEADLHARHAWLVGQREVLRARLEGDPSWYDAQIAGWWCWGISCWIGAGFCSGSGPWQSVEVAPGDRQLVHLGDGGVGVNRQRPHLGTSQGVNRKRPHLGNSGMGVNRRRVHLGDDGRGGCRLEPWFQALRDRLARVRVCSGDWSRVCGPTPTWKVGGLCGVFLDPPYADTAGRDGDIYREDSETVAHAVREWAIEAGERSDMRIVLAGYEGEHEMPATWRVVAWKAHGGYGGQSLTHDNPNALRERLWLSPACVDQAQLGLDFGGAA